MRRAVIVDAVRTPIARGKPDGGLHAVHPVGLLAVVLDALVERVGLDPSRVDDVLVGCVTQAGEQALNIARNAVLAAGFPEVVPGTTVDRQCGSSQQAAHFAAQGVMAGAYDIAIAAGVESMSRMPMGSAVQGRDPFDAALTTRYAPGLVPQGVSAELIARAWGLSRRRLDELALASHQKAAVAADTGRFDAELVPVEVTQVDGTVHVLDADEAIRRDTDIERLGSLPPAFASPSWEDRFGPLDWVVSAGNSSPINDGAAALLIMGEDTASALGLRARAAFHSFAVAGDDPIMMLTAIMPATARVLTRAGLDIDDIDAFEVNEAFASVIGAWLAETGADPERLNMHGGAMALGPPLGASGARLMTTLVHVLEQTGGRYGLQVMCEAGGLANATILERL